jgi:adenylate kinase family enzyme
MRMKIYIVGAVSSGKSTLAKKLSKVSGISYRSLDEVVHVPDSSSPCGNIKRQAEDRDKLFSSIIQEPDWIIEDVGRPCFEAGMKEADMIVLLEIPSAIRNCRIIKRWFRQRLGLEECLYTPCFEMLRSMLRWSKDYDSQKDGLKSRIGRYSGKLVTLGNNKDIEAFLGHY